MVRCFYNDYFWNSWCNKKMKKTNLFKLQIIFLLPITVLIIICIFFSIYILQKRSPNEPPSALLGKDIPFFETKNLFNESIILNNKNLKNKYVLINFFASWCAPCKVEHPLFFEIKKDYPNLYLLGINHKDKLKNAFTYLDEEGDPYNFVGLDSDGLLAIEFGVFGLPETFLINPNGKIIYKHLGPLTKKIIKNEIKPLLH